MIPVLYDKTGANKIGDLNDCIECFVEEERNGIFELTMIYPANSSILESIVYDNIIVADANDYLKSQKFRVYNTRKLMANRIEVCARHISFDLVHDWVDVISIENQPCEYALNTIFRNSQFSKHFKGYSDIINAQNFKVNKVTCLEAIGGASGSIIDTYGTGAEILRDNTDIHVLNRRGHDNDVVIEYRKNLTGLEVEEDTTDLVTRIMPYAIYTNSNDEEIEVRGDFIDSPLINNYAHPYVKYMDYSEKFEDDEVPTKTKLNNLAAKEYINNKVDIPKNNYKIEFIPLSKCAGYEGLEDRINLCDIVTVKDSRYSIDTQAKVIKVVFDVLRGRYDSMELGEPRTTLGDIIGGTGDGPTQGPPGPPGPQGPAGADGSIGDFPQTLPEVPNITAKVYGFANIELSWTFENKVYYSYELYASKTKGFAPNTFNLIFSGQASTYLFQAEPSETWYFRACALNTHGQRTEFSSEVEVSTVKISDLSNYVESAAIGDALIGELNLGRGWYGELKGNYIDARQLSVTDGSGKRTLDIDSFGNVNLDVTSLKIKNNSVATESFVSNAKNDAINSANNNTTIALENHYTKSETDSKISVAKDEINLGVSNTYETKTNVETKVSSTLNSAKSYADTKKTEAINTAASDATSKANNAKSEAIESANNTLTSTISNYYTKAQTDSQINVAKDAINLGVSQTYETKANVETKVSSTLNSAKSYADTKKTEAINSANSTLSTTIQNYYTKTETNSQINIAKNAVTTSVSNLETKVMGATYTNLLTNSDFLIGEPIPRGYLANNTDYVCMSDWLLHGAKAIKINVSGAIANAWIGVLTTWIKAIEGQRFTASADVITSSRSGLDQGCAIEIEWYDSNENRIDVSSQPFTPKTNNIWERVAVTGTAPRGTVKARVRVHVVRNGILYVTRMMLQEGEIATAWVRGGDIDTVEERLTIAEQKITDDSITNTVKKNFYTKEETNNAITSKGYATQSQLQQTANNITSTVSQNYYTKQETENTINNKNFATKSEVQQTAENVQFRFSQSGGYNLIRNGNPKPWHEENWLVSGNGWWYRGNSNDLGIQTYDTNEAYAGTSVFKVQPGVSYSLSCWLFAEGNTKGANVYFIGSSKDDGSYEDVQHLFGGGKDGWTHVKASFTTGSNTNYGFIRIDNNGRKDTSTGSNTVVFFSEVQMVKGSECYPQWSPNPNEIYDGITTIDKDGVKVVHGGSYSRLGAHGLMRYDGDVGKYYHYLSYMGQVDLASEERATIQLPPEFRNRDFKVIVSVKRVRMNYDPYAEKHLLMGFYAEVNSINTANATFEVYASVRAIKSTNFNGSITGADYGHDTLRPVVAYWVYA